MRSDIDDNETMRVFFALQPDEACANRLCAVANELAARYGGRATLRETLHLTLAFVGNVSKERLPDLQEIADAVKTLLPASPEAGLWRLDHLVCREYRQMLWAGSRHCPSQLETLAGLLAEKLRAGGYVIPTRHFTPHVTLIRKLKTIPQSADLEILQTAPLPWRYRGFVLLRSRASGLRPAYECLGSWMLGDS